MSFAAISSSAAFYILSPRASQPFMTFGVYSRNGLEQYLSTFNSTVSPGNTTTWTLSATNRMGSAQLVMIIVRIGNSSLLSCSALSQCSPNATAPATWFPQVSSFEQFIGDGSTSNANFTWSLEPGSNQTRLNLRVNGVSVSSAPVGAGPGESFRWIFELWTFDPACGSQDPISTACFHYGYGPKTSPTGSWLQVWFNLSS